MAKYLDATGLGTLWSTCKSTFLTTGGGDNRYLKLTGGTLTSSNNILNLSSTNSESYIYFASTVNSESSARASVGYYNGLAFIANEVGGTARIGVNNSGVPQYWSDAWAGNIYTLVHAGNIGDYNSGTATTLQTSRLLWGNSFNGSSDINGSIQTAFGKIIRIGSDDGSGGSSNVRNYVSAGPGFSSNSGRYGVKVVACDQHDCVSGLGQDNVIGNGWGNAYNFCVIGGNSSTDYGYISFCTHKTTSTDYRYIGGFYDNAGTVIFNVQGEIKSTGQFRSTVATGTAPLIVSSTTCVSNLNADLLDGKEASAFATSDHNHDNTYLKLSGGTLSTTNYPVLSIDGTNSTLKYSFIHYKYCGTTKAASGYVLSTGDSGIAFISNEGANYAKIGVTDAGLPQFWSNGDTSKYTIWHEGNDGSGSGLDADLLDGLNSSDFFRYYGTEHGDADNGALGTGYGYGDPDHWATWGATMAFGIPQHHVQLQGYYYGSQLYARTKIGNTGEYSSWREIAFTDMNVASSTYATSAGSVAWSGVSSKPDTATRWPSWSEVTSKPSTFTPATHDHDSSYLKLSGGTLSSSNDILHVTSSNSNSWIYFYKDTSTCAASVGYYASFAFLANEIGGYARIGINNSGVPQYWTDSGGTHKYTLYHEGNSNSTSFSWSASSLSLNGTISGATTISASSYLSISSGGSVRVGTPGAGGSSSISSYVSAGPGYSPNSGRYGVKVLACDQSDCQSGMGQDLGGNAYEFSLAGCNSSEDWGYISFVTHIANSTTYRRLGGFYDNAGTVTFTVNGKIVKQGGTSSQFLKADGSVDSNTYLTMSSNLTNSEIDTIMV